jgi:hypothetical protein
MKALVIRAVVVLAIVSGFTVSAEAKPVGMEPASISITSTVSAVGVLAKR